MAQDVIMGNSLGFLERARIVIRLAGGTNAKNNALVEQDFRFHCAKRRRSRAARIALVPSISRVAGY